MWGAGGVGGRNTPDRFMLHKPEIRTGLGSYAEFAFHRRKFTREMDINGYIGGKYSNGMQIKYHSTMLLKKITNFA